MSDAHSAQPLNPNQQAAVAHLTGRLLVVAGAGTGKTRVIEARTAHLLDAGVPPEQILLLTFTRKAAREMLERAAKQHPLAHRVDGGTFHHLAYRIVARHHAALGFERPPSVIDADDAANAIAATIARLGLAGPKNDRLPRARALYAAFSRATNTRAALSDVLAQDLPQWLERAEQLQRVRREWARYKLERGYVDYDDLLVLAARALENANLQRTIANKWQHVMVDEYQDVNAWQASMTDALAPHHNLMVVGDPRQSIYGFRGAQFEKIHRFADASAAPTRTIELTDNYRSNQPILNLANAVMAQMDDTHYTPLRAAADGHHDASVASPTLVVVEDDRDAAERIADTMVEAIQEPGALGGRAVLVRNAYQSVPLQGELLRRRIPFAVYGGMRFTETAHVKDVLAALRVVHNPFDELAWMRLLQLLPGIGETTAARIFADLADPEALAVTQAADPIVRAQQRAQQVVPKAARETFLGLMAALTRAQGLPPIQAFDAALAWYQPLLEARYPGERYRLQDLQFMRVVVERYAALDELLADLALDPDATRQAGEGESPTPEGLTPLTISTIHSAKGLEWDRVVLLGVDDRTLPSAHALRRANQEGDTRELEEEKRLLYVAITRARRELTLMHVLFTRQGLGRLSRFLHDERAAAVLQHEGGEEREVRAEAGTHRRSISRDDLLDALAGDP